ncbi:hypothetical protein Rleg2_1149 [Rhizobium leguminosarum bv. trifolii WSM2304]|uniref:Uncharacterized protein n=1 Tax=Rhizobium leguminosarum bv. trifolii (strain WSM2304) TaxID=395492 RepID=A0ABF7QK80_RHILW|nr:hypothetical protein [Rhizobium leguminosarum]ACI54443.1 hypothetical protein Rleg2_1149 [Rhizobium leguminosarum bv. trifolii WSM2304]
MVATRPGAFDGSLFTLFPRALSNSSLSPTLLSGSQYARKLINIIPNKKKGGSGALRYGMGTKGPEMGVEQEDGWEYRRSDGTIEVIVLGSDNALYRYDEALDAYEEVKTGLSSLGMVGTTTFNGKLIFYNGQDANFSYDGTDFTDLGEYVEDRLAGSYTWISSSSFSLKPAGGRSDYPDGRMVRVKFVSSDPIEATVASSSLVGDTLTVTVTGTPFPASSEVIEMIEYFDEPPPFSFITTANDKLWALSGGVSRPKVYRGSDPMKAFYTTAENNENSWFDQGTDTSTQEVAYINIQNKANVFDELLAIGSYNGAMVFYGRLRTYIWQGYDPGEIGGFIPVKTLAVGLIHQKLRQSMPNDEAFVTPFGLRTLSVQVQTDGVEVTSDIGSTQDGEFSDKIRALLADDDSYRKARSFFYQRDGMFGYKLDDTGLQVYVLNDKAKGWTEFQGYFADAASFVALGDNRLMILRGEQAYLYANGTDALVGESYADDEEPIFGMWWLPWLSRSARWGNRAVEILLEDTAPNVTLTLDRMIDFREQNVVTTQVTVTGGGSKWDEALWDVGMWDSGTINPVVTDKFLADKAFSYRLSFSTTEGPVNLLGLRPIGR